MKTSAWLVASLVVLIGVAGLVMPGGFTLIAGYVLTPMGLFFVGVLRVVIGFILFRSAPASRYPAVLRVLGIVIMIAGFATPLIGIDRTRVQFDWMWSQGPLFIRAIAGILIIVGAMLAYAVSPNRRLPA